MVGRKLQDGREKAIVPGAIAAEAGSPWRGGHSALW